MTEEATRQFLSCARAELVRIEIALSEMPALKLKEELLRDLLILYGEKHIGHGRPSEALENQPQVKVDVSKPEKPTVDKTIPVSETSLKHMQQRADREDRKDLGKARAHAAVPRPDGIPTTYQMSFQVLRDGPEDGLTATLLVDEIRKKWWPGVTFNQIAPEFYRYVSEGRFNRDNHGKMTLTEKGRKIGSNPTAGLPRDMTVSTKAHAIANGKHKPPAPQQPAPPAPTAKLTPEQLDEARAKLAASQGEPKLRTHDAFEHNGHKITLPLAEARLAQHLHALMGQGCVGHDALAKAAGGAKNGRSDKLYIEDLVYALNTKIVHAKLQIVPYEKLGFYMKETP